MPSGVLNQPGQRRLDQPSAKPQSLFNVTQQFRLRPVEVSKSTISHIINAERNSWIISTNLTSKIPGFTIRMNHPSVKNAHLAPAQLNLSVLAIVFNQAVFFIYVVVSVVIIGSILFSRI